MTDKLPELPQKRRLLNLNTATTEEYLRHLSSMISYHCERVAYWESRCRLAVEALHHLSAMVEVDPMKDLAKGIIGTIGPLP